MSEAVVSVQSAPGAAWLQNRSFGTVQYGMCKERSFLLGSSRGYVTRIKGTCQSHTAGGNKYLFMPLWDLPMKNGGPGSYGGSTKTPETNDSLRKVWLPSNLLKSKANLINLQREPKVSRPGSSSGTLQMGPGSQLKLWWTTTPYRIS
jgi:hypothetical protein